MNCASLIMILESTSQGVLGTHDGLLVSFPILKSGISFEEGENWQYALGRLAA